MGEQHTNLEIIATSVEEAVEKGLAELGLTQEDVDVEILDQGSRGLFGLGSRQARVRLTIRSGEIELDGAESKIERSPEPVKTAADPKVEEAPEYDEFDEPEPSDAEQDLVLRISGDVVRELLNKMKVRATVSTHFVAAEDEHSKPVAWVDVHGNDLSILIGPRTETLNALQYIAGLIASKEIGHTVPLVVDVEGFRARRIHQLRQLARRMADQAVKTGRRQVLEPMPASERRIVHIELRSNPLVTTESIGEEPRRKVTIIPK
jgi:spoIIIJ-associated protein